MKRYPAFAFFSLAWLASCAPLPSLQDGLYARLDTSKGVIVCSLEFREAPLTTANFVGLAEGTIAANGVTGKHYFDGLSFHRVVADAVIQSGDPKGDGTGGPGYIFPNEISPKLKHDAPGVLAMANAGPNTNGSQFYITLRAIPQLDGGYSVFGRVVQGQEVAKAIAQGDKIKEVKILRVGSAAKAFKVDQEGFAAMIEKKRAENRAEDLAFIARKWPNLIKTPTGLMYLVLAQGSGKSPAAGAAVTVHYEGKFLSGKLFDSSLKAGTPAKFKIGQVIKGWDEALLSMKKGEKRLLVVPPELGYGEMGYPGAIPPDSFLVFEVELIDFQ